MTDKIVSLNKIKDDKVKEIAENLLLKCNYTDTLELINIIEQEYENSKVLLGTHETFGNYYKGSLKDHHFEYLINRVKEAEAFSRKFLNLR